MAMAARADDNPAPPSWAAAAAARVEARTAFATVIFGIYLLIMSGVYAWPFHDVYPRSISFSLANASMATAYIAQICNIGIIYGLYVRKFLGCPRDLFYALCGSLAVSMVTAPITLLTMICGIGGRENGAALWEMARFGGVLVHMSLVRRFIRDLRGKHFKKSCSTPTLASPPTPPNQPSQLTQPTQLTQLPTPPTPPTPPSPPSPTPPPLPTSPPPPLTPTHRASSRKEPAAAALSSAT